MIGTKKLINIFQPRIIYQVSSAIRWYQCESSGYTIDEKIGCHKVYNSSEVKTWEQAQEVCKENGANLAVLKSKAEAEVK